MWRPNGVLRCFLPGQSGHSGFQEYIAIRNCTNAASAIVLAALGMFSVAAQAQDERLTGDWGGARSRMEAAGVKLDLELTLFEQGLVSGSGSGQYYFGHRWDGFVKLDTRKMGLWDGGDFVTHLEYFTGDLPGTLGGVFWPTNAGMHFPGDAANELVATSLYYAQRFGERGLLMIGKINALDLLSNDRLFGGWGNHRFFNAVFVAPPTGLVPPVFMGAIGSYRTDWGSMSLWIYDPMDRTNQYAPNDLFDNGVTFYLKPTWNMMLDGRASTFSLGGIYTTKSGVDYASISGSLQSGIVPSTKEGSYSVGFEFSHLLHADPADPRKGWGVNVKGAVSDGNPNYVQRSLILGIAGTGLIPGRERDSFGLGYFYYNLSDDLQDALSPNGRLGDEQGLSAFYSYAVTPWLYLSADLQYIEPPRTGLKNAFVAGVRANIRF
jgi:porin